MCAVILVVVAFEGLARASLRTPPLARRSPVCGLQDDDPPLLSEAREFFASHSVRLHRVKATGPGSRTTSRLAVRPDGNGSTIIGMFAPGSHDVIPCDQDASCHLPQHPMINMAVEALGHELSAFGALSAYDERAESGTLRYAQFSVERLTQRVQITLVVNAATLVEDPAIERFAKALWEAHDRDDRIDAPIADGSPAAAEAPCGTPHLNLHSLWVNLNPTRTNNILSYEPGAWRLLHALADGGSIVERLNSGASFVLPPYVFRQANMEGFDAIVRQVRDAVPAGARVVEWYAGVGVLGLSLAPDVEWVRCSDVNPSLDAFEASRELLSPCMQERVTFAIGSAAEPERIEDARGADCAVVDPPRKGLDAQLLAALCDGASSTSADGPCSGIATLVYVSCGFPALARDAEALLEAGWRVRADEATAHILFPGADHIETVVVFERETLPPQPISEESSQQQAGVDEEAPPTRRRRDPASPRARRLAANKRRARRVG